MAHMYQDISHHRAPYKNVMVSGFGNGETKVAEANPLDQFTFINALGLRQVKPEQASALTTKLMYMGATLITDENYKLTMYPQQAIDIIQKQPTSDTARILVSLSGIGVVKKWLDEKKIPFISPSVMIPSPADQELGAIALSDKERISQLANSGLRDSMFAYALPGETNLANVDPTPAAVSKAGITISKNTLYVLLGLGVAGIGYYGYKHYAKKSHRGY